MPDPGENDSSPLAAEVDLRNFSADANARSNCAICSYKKIVCMCVWHKRKNKENLHPVIETREEMSLKEVGRKVEGGRRGVKEEKKKKRCK